MDRIHYILLVNAAICVLVTLIPFVRSDYWTFRIFDFPRLQKLVVNLLLLVLMAIYFVNSPIYLTGFGLLILNSLYLIRVIVPYTPFVPTWVRRPDKIEEENCISIVVSNVFQDNKDFEGCLKVLKNANPDVILLLETDTKWMSHVSSIEQSHPHRVSIPQENTYGMLFFSRLPLRNVEIKFQVEDEVPSIFCQVQLPSGVWIQFYCLHPTPPSPTENLRSTERDQELLMTAALAKKQKAPVVVMGDLNDVAWSYSTELFLKMSGLLDPRIGRGFFNSFNAKIPLMRFPLDHVFVSSHFRHIKTERLDNFHSDHFPIYGKYQYDPSAVLDQEELEPDREDIEIAEEKRDAVDPV